MRHSINQQQVFKKRKSTVLRRLAFVVLGFNARSLEIQGPIQKQTKTEKPFTAQYDKNSPSGSG